MHLSLRMAREMRQGRVVCTVGCDASHSGHKDSKGHSFYDIRFRARVTDFCAGAAGKKHSSQALSSSEEEAMGAVRGSLKAVEAMDVFDQATQGEEETTRARENMSAVLSGDSTVQSNGVRGELQLDAAVTIQQVLTGNLERCSQRHARMRSRWLHELWRKQGNSVTI